MMPLATFKRPDIEPATCDLLITKPGYEPVRLGPFRPAIASQNAASLQQQMAYTAHPLGTRIVVAHHTAGCDHPDFTDITPTDSGTIATIMDQESDNPGERFPDLYARLVLRHGHEQASRLWSVACRIYDGDEA